MVNTQEQYLESGLYLSRIHEFSIGSHIQHCSAFNGYLIVSTTHRRDDSLQTSLRKKYGIVQRRGCEQASKFSKSEQRLDTASVPNLMVAVLLPNLKCRLASRGIVGRQSLNWH